MENKEIKIIDLNENNLKAYCMCLEEWSDEIKESGNHKEKWYYRNKDNGLRVKLAEVDDKICGMIQYVPAEYSWINGRDIYFIMCIWVHGYKKGIGNFQKRGVGKALLESAEEDVRSMGKKGIAAWGIALPFWMKASWFKKRGYVKADSDSMAVLVWKKFTEDAEKPSFIKIKKRPEVSGDKVKVHCLINGWCPGYNLVYERTKRACSDLTDKVDFITIDTSDRNNFNEWGISDAVYIEKKALRMGPPMPYKKIRKRIEKSIKRKM